jgi:hypothetical protein
MKIQIPEIWFPMDEKVLNNGGEWTYLSFKIKSFIVIICNFYW